MIFNINDEIKVKLTRKGLRFHREYYYEIYKNTNFEYTEPPVDGDGYSTFQLWEVMHIFGKHLYNGCQMPFEANIIIPENQ